MTLQSRATEYEPFRTQLDPIKTPEAIWAGVQMLQGADDRPDLEDVIEVLMREAAKTERAITRPRPAGYSSAYPEVNFTLAEIRFAKNARTEGGIPEEPNPDRPQATAAEMSRYQEVTLWLRFVEGRCRAQSKRVLWQLAKGVHPHKIAREEGYPNIRAVYSKQKRELANIAKRLKRELPQILASLG